MICYNDFEEVSAILAYEKEIQFEDFTCTHTLQDKYIFDNNQMLLEDEWTSMTYLRKSLMEENVTVEKDPLGGTSEGAILEKNVLILIPSAIRLPKDTPKEIIPCISWTVNVAVYSFIAFLP